MVGPEGDGDGSAGRLAIEGAPGRRAVLSGLVAALILPLAAGPLAAATPELLRIGTGGKGGTYYPIGSLLAAALSASPGEGACAEGPCGVPGAFAVAQISNGSVANVEGLQAGQIELALVQSDVLQWAYTATQRFAGRPGFGGLRAVASLYLETMHLVARADAGIGSVADLAGRRVSLDEIGSGTILDAREVLHRFGLTEADFKAEYIKPDAALARMAEGTLDAFFILAGYPVGSIVETAKRVPLTLVPIQGPPVAAMVAELKSYAQTVIPGGVYQGIPATPTIAVGALLATRADLAPDLIYRVTAALWSPRARRLLDAGHPKGRQIRLEHALDGIPIPLHDGARRFYREHGLIE